MTDCTYCVFKDTCRFFEYETRCPILDDPPQEDPEYTQLLLNI